MGPYHIVEPPDWQRTAMHCSVTSRLFGWSSAWTAGQNILTLRSARLLSFLLTMDFARSTACFLLAAKHQHSGVLRQHWSAGRAPLALHLACRMEMQEFSASPLTILLMPATNSLLGLHVCRLSHGFQDLSWPRTLPSHMHAACGLPGQLLVPHHADMI